MRRWSQCRWWLVPVLTLLCVALPHLDQGDYRSDTARYAAVGLQMWRTGDLLTPHLHPSQPYFNKPPFAFWVHGLALHLAGPSLVATRLPTVLAAALAVALATIWVRREAGRRMALVAGLVLALTMEFFRRTRELSLDLWQLVFLLAAAVAVTRGLRRPARGAFALAGAALGLALLCKPLVALLCLPMFGIWLWTAGRRNPAAPLLVMLATALAVAAPWHLAQAQRWGPTFFRQYLGAEVVARARGEINREGPLYYAVEIGSTYWPWMLALAGTIVLWSRGRLARHRLPALRRAAWWASLWFIALTAFPDKRPRYELPLYPALAWLAAESLLRLPWRPLRRWLLRGCRGLAPAAVALSALLSVLPVRVQAPPQRCWGELFAWMRRTGVTALHGPGLQSNQAARFYLEFGWWPVPVGDVSARHRDVPDGALLVYDGTPGQQPGRYETVVFTSGPVTVTRLQRPR